MLKYALHFLQIAQSAKICCCDDEFVSEGVKLCGVRTSATNFADAQQRTAQDETKQNVPTYLPNKFRCAREFFARIVLVVIQPQ